MADYDNYESDGKPRYPKVLTHFPIDSLTPTSKCPHKGKYKKGVRLVCMVCEQSGVDHFKALRRDRRKEPKPEPKVPKHETRKASRAAKNDPKKPKNARAIADKQRLAKLAERAAAALGYA